MDRPTLSARPDGMLVLSGTSAAPEPAAGKLAAPDRPGRRPPYAHPHRSSAHQQPPGMHTGSPGDTALDCERPAIPARRDGADARPDQLHPGQPPPRASSAMPGLWQPCGPSPPTAQVAKPHQELSMCEQSANHFPADNDRKLFTPLIIAKLRLLNASSWLSQSLTLSGEREGQRPSQPFFVWFWRGFAAPKPHEISAADAAHDVSWLSQSLMSYDIRLCESHECVVGSALHQ